MRWRWYKKKKFSMLSVTKVNDVFFCNLESVHMNNTVSSQTTWKNAMDSQRGHRQIHARSVNLFSNFLIDSLSTCQVISFLLIILKNMKFCGMREEEEWREGDKLIVIEFELNNNKNFREISLIKLIHFSFVFVVLFFEWK